MAEEFGPQVARHLDEGKTRDPAGDPPQQIIGRHDETRIAKASHGLPPCLGSRDRTSTRNLTPYCVLTEQVTAPSTARMMTP